MNTSKLEVLRITTTSLVGAISLLSLACPAVAANPRSWNSYTWGRTGNLSIQLVNNTSAAWTPYLITAASQWSAAANIDFRVVSGPAINGAVCAPSYGVVEVCSANYGKNGWLGMTNVFTSGGRIVMATIRYNDYYPSTSTTYAGAAWYTNTSCHELGHVLGLAHLDVNRNNTNAGSCLDASADPTGKKKAYGPLSNLAPGAMDFAALAEIYKSPSGTQLASTTYSMSSDGSFVPEPATWLLLVAGFGLVGSSMRRRSANTVLA